jgi:tRNA-splicing ligase RtcB
MGNMPFIYSHVAVMPDAHAGKGSTVGTVIASQGAIIPAAVGVDIGCGMCAVKLPFQIELFGDDVSKLRHSIERSVPVGFNENKEVSERAGEALTAIEGGLSTQKGINLDKVGRQLGSLGGGNHFIEICADSKGGAWVVLHSGSRNIGKTLAEIHIEKAKGLMKSYFIDLPDPDLAYLAQGTVEFKAYIQDLLWAQQYAKANRNEMMLRVLKDISFSVYGEDKGSEFMTTLRVDCHHNYTAMEHHDGKNVWITRKGAVSAKAGELGIIPGSMGTKDSFCSCSHGAGRRMSRTRAKANFTIEDLREQTSGVECRKDKDVIDEIPGAYKDIDQVMENQRDLVKPIHVLKQIMCIKG